MTEDKFARFAREQEADFTGDVEKYGELENCVVSEDGKLKVKWDNLLFLRKAEPMMYSKILRYLSYKGVLTTSPKDGLMLMGAGVPVNPHSLIAPTMYYFKRKEDAEAYARAGYGNALYDVDIIKIEKSGVNK